MKKTVFKKVVAAVLSLAMVVTGLYVVAPEAEEVKAADSAAVVDVYTATQFSEIVGTAPTKEGKVFAGWYADADCTIPVTEGKTTQYVAGAKYYARFVDEGVLSVKVQLADDANGAKQMRVLSSVDNLDYQQVGFDVYFGNATSPVEFTTTQVFKTIKATANGVAYQYSNKVIDAASEYFVSGTIKGISSTKLDTDFYIKPFWVTPDGTKAYGVGKMFSVNDGYNAGAFNITIPGVEAPESDKVSVTLNGTLVEESEVIGYKDGNLFLNVPVVKTTLPSTNKVVYNETTAIYEKLVSVKDVVADYSWYDVNPDAKTFYIASVADFWGFHNILNALDGRTLDDFYGQEVVLVSDINALGLSAGAATEWATNQAAPEGTKVWTPANFYGTLNGNGNELSGLYISGSSDGIALFKYMGGTVKNLRMENCYITNPANKYWTAAIAGTLRGVVDNVYIGETVYIHTDQSVGGGIAGRIANHKNLGDGYSSKITNAWFAGTVKQTASVNRTGGLAGDVATDVQKLLIENCLITGTIIGRNVVAQMLGQVAGTPTQVLIKNSVAAGTSTATRTGADTTHGAIIGNVGTGAKITLDDVYTTSTVVYTREDKLENAGVGSNKGTVKGSINVIDATPGASGSATTQTLNSDMMIGNAAYVNLNLDYWSKANEEGVWVVTETGTPQLKAFTTYAKDTWKDGYTGEGTIKHKGWFATQTITNGTYANPNAKPEIVFELETAADLYGLQEMSLDYDFYKNQIEFKKDIDLNPGLDMTNEEDRAIAQKWEPIRPGSSVNFMGCINGKGHTLKGMYIVAESDLSGFIHHAYGGGGYLDTIKNIAFANSYVDTNGYKQCGVVAGKADKTTVDSVYVGKDVIIEGSEGKQADGYAYTGGIFGVTNYGKLTNCQFAGVMNTPSPSEANGGLIGSINNVNPNDRVVLDNCAFTGVINASDWKVGALVGRSGATTIIQNCVSNGQINGKTNGGMSAIIGIVAWNVTVNNVYTSTTLLNRNSGAIRPDDPKSENNYTLKGSGIALRDDQIKGANAIRNMPALDFGESGPWVATADGPEMKAFSKSTTKVQDTVTTITPDFAWYENEKVDGAIPENTTFEIATVAELYGLTELVEQGITFKGHTVELTASEYDFNPGWVAANRTESADANEWLPIGHKSTVFDGTFNGNGAVIKGINVMARGRNNVGFFGNVGSFSSINDFTIANSYIESRQNDAKEGILVGVMGRLGGTADGIHVAGDVTIVSDTEIVGGIVGRYDAGITAGGDTSVMTGGIINSWSEATIKSTTSNGKYVGGIIGQLWSAPKDGGALVEDSLFTGTIVSENGRVGGILGMSYEIGNGIIQNTVSNGAIYCSVGSVDTVVSHFGTVNQGQDVCDITLSGVYSNGNLKNLDGSEREADINYPEQIKGDSVVIVENFASADEFTTLDFNGTWTITENGPVLTQFQ